MLLAATERRIGLAHKLAGLIADPRNPLLITHSDPGFKLAAYRMPAAISVRSQRYRARKTLPLCAN